MKRLVSVPVYGLMFWRATSLNHLTAQHGRYFSAVKAVRQGVLSKPVLNSKEQRNNHSQKRFSSSGDSADLMDFEVWARPKIFYIPRIFYYHKKLSDLENFSLPEFIECSAKALHVVATLLSQLRFPELEGLLTPECMKQVSKNLESWTKPQASCLFFQPEHLSSCIPCDIYVSSDEKNAEKMFAEIRMIYHVWLEFCEKIGKKEYAFPLDEKEGDKKSSKLYMHAVYNCTFIKEVTKGITDQWTINKINLKSFPYGFSPSLKFV